MISRTLEISSNLIYAYPGLADGNILYRTCHGEKNVCIKFGATVLAQSPHLTGGNQSSEKLVNLLKIP